MLYKKTSCNNQIKFITVEDLTKYKKIKTILKGSKTEIIYKIY